jgi:hypothetical protein
MTKTKRREAMKEEKMNRGEGWAFVVGVMMLIAVGAVGHWCIAAKDAQIYKEPFFKAIEGEDLKTNPLFQISGNCMLQKPTAVKSKGEKDTVIFTYTKTCKEGEAVITDYLFAICGRHYSYGQDEYIKIQCQTSGWIQLH